MNKLAALPNTDSLFVGDIHLQALKEINGYYDRALSTSTHQLPAPKIKVGKRVLNHGPSYVGLINALDDVHRMIREHQVDDVELVIGEQVHHIKKVPIGEGLTGVVYELVGQPEVIKLARGNAVSVASMLHEQRVAPELKEIVARHKGFHLPGNMRFDRWGLWSTRRRIFGEPLGALFVRTGLIEVSTKEVRMTDTVGNEMRTEFVARFNINPTEVVSDYALQMQVEKLIVLRRDHPDLIQDIGPDNLMVSYDTKDLYLVDIGRCGPQTIQRFKSVFSFEDYKEAARPLILRYCETGVFRPSLEGTPH